MFWLRIKKINFWYTLLTKGLVYRDRFARCQCTSCLIQRQMPYSNYKTKNNEVFYCYREALADGRRAVTIKPDFSKVNS